MQSALMIPMRTTGTKRIGVYVTEGTQKVTKWVHSHIHTYTHNIIQSRWLHGLPCHWTATVTFVSVLNQTPVSVHSQHVTNVSAAALLRKMWLFSTTPVWHVVWGRHILRLFSTTCVNGVLIAAHVDIKCALSKARCAIKKPSADGWAEDATSHCAQH